MTIIKYLNVSNNEAIEVVVLLPAKKTGKKKGGGKR